MSVTERAFAFDCAGEQLVGIIAEPAASRRLGVLVIVGGWQYRVGSHRQFLLLARRLAAQGFPVMRFDYRGMGDSSGDMRSFEDIVPDIAAAIDAFQTACPSLQDVVLWGICDAASASLMYWKATQDARVAGITMLNPWVLSDETFARSQLKHHFRKRLVQRDLWIRLVRGRIDVLAAARSFADVVITACRAPRGAEASGGGYRNVMASGLAAFTRPVLIILSDRDPAAKAFVEYCGSHRRWRGLIDRPNVESRNHPDADHTFSAAAWRQDVEAITLDWLKRSFRR